MGVAEIKLIQTFKEVLVTYKWVMIHSKMKVLEWSQEISHCKYMQIFYDAQGKLTPQSKVGSTLNLTHPSFYGCPCYLKEWRRSNKKMKALEWSQHYQSIFKMLKGS